MATVDRAERPFSVPQVGRFPAYEVTGLVADGVRQLSIVLIGHPKLKNDLRRPKMEEIGDRTTVFEFGGLRDRQRDYIDWVMKASLQDDIAQAGVLTDGAAPLLPPS